MRSTRTEDINFIVKIIGRNFKLNQFNRLQKGDLFPEEDYEKVIDALMEYFVNTEEYEKCSVLKKMKNNEK